MIESRISPDGRITVPPEVRAALGLKDGDLLRYEIDGDRVLVSKGGDEDDQGEDLLLAEALDPIIDAALADKRPTLPINDVRAALYTRLDDRRSVNAA